MAIPPFVVPYDPDFLGDGFSVPLPKLTGATLATAYQGGKVIDYVHYSLVMSETRKVALYSACNLDGERHVLGIGREGIHWRRDDRAGDAQLGEEVYHGTAWDKGHQTRREDVLWGRRAEALAANESTFFLTNAAPQHASFNQDEWAKLEDWVFRRATEMSYRLNVFTGPVLSADDPPWFPAERALDPRSVRIPAAFWKVCVLRDEAAGGQDLSVVAFAMRQTGMWNDRDGARMLNLKTHQVSLRTIEQWTGLDFGPLRKADELAWSDERLRSVVEQPFPLVRGPDDIRFNGAERRRDGSRVLPAGERAGRRFVAEPPRLGGAAGGCGCGGEVDGRAALAALSKRVEALAELVAQTPEVLGSALAFRALPLDGAQRDALFSSAPPRIDVGLDDDTRVKINDITARALRIVGGAPATPGQFDSCCCLGRAGGASWFCSGVLIHPRLVLTAAHCVPAGIERVLVGATQVPPSGVDGRSFLVDQVYQHEDYREGASVPNDLCLVVLAGAVTHVAPAPLATFEDLRKARLVQLVGFGRNDLAGSAGFGTKRFVEVAADPDQFFAGPALEDLAATKGFNPLTEFVAGRKSLGQDTCYGDSGGPAYVLVDGHHAVAGITSRWTSDHARPCGDGGIYTRVDAYLDWIARMASRRGIDFKP